MNNILITNIGRRGYLVEYIKETDYFTGKVYVSDCDNTAAGLYGNNDGHFILPRPVDNPDKYVSQLVILCKKYDIGMVIPVIDPEIDILSEYRSIFWENDIVVTVSDKHVLDICYNKSNMNKFLGDNNFLVPKTYFSINDFKCSIDRREIDFPVIIKPIYGSGSVSTYIVNSIEKLNSLFVDGMMIQEYIDGQEFGVDILNNFGGKPVRCVVKKKLSMRSGETDKALVVKNEYIQAESIRLAKLLGHVCNLDCDILEKEEKIYIIDMNPRFGGGYPATHLSGENYLELIMRMKNGEVVLEDFDSYKDNILALKEIHIIKAEAKNE